MSFLDLFRNQKLSSVLCKTYKVKVQGVKFELRKLNPLDYLNGSKALLQVYDTYKSTSAEKQADLVNINKIKDHYADVFMASVIEPKLSRKLDEAGTIYVDNLFSDWDFATDLYAKIMEITYGKKKMKQLVSQKTN